MTLPESFYVSSNGFLSALVWLLALAALLYLARQPAHRMILSLAQALHNGFRLAAKAVSLAHDRLAARNREVLLAAGREAAEQTIEREFERIDATVKRDLVHYPALHRGLSDCVAEIEEDYAKSSETPPPPPGWSEAVNAVANIPNKDNPAIGKILGLIHGSMVEAEEEAIAAYREASTERHKHLNKMMPRWRQVADGLSKVDRNVKSLLKRSESIDRHMDDYQNIIQDTERAERTLAASSLVHFIIAAVVLSVAVGGAMINFSLIARPMSEMFGGNNTVGGFRTADVAALVIIFVEMSMGLFLMESLRVTRLFPIIGSLPDKMRVRMVWATFAILLALACVEVGLAYMREMLLQDELATNAILRGGAAGASDMQSSFEWITMVAQMGMGFVLPFALIFVAIPLETFVLSSRNVFGAAATGFLKAFAFLLRLMATTCRYGGAVMVEAYDVLIFGPLWLETTIKTRVADRASRALSRRQQ
jgi:hypothetical protein